MKSTERFSSIVDDYIKYRPGYPQELISFIDRITGGLRGLTVADIGSGTGKLTEPLLHAGAEVYAIEPNADMRNAAEVLFHDLKGFHSLEGTAESTNLNDNSADVVVAAQAFHWFDQPKAKTEFQRILKDKDQYVFLIWNNRNNEVPFMKGRYDSCSYALPDTHELYPESISSLQSLFDHNSLDGEITLFSHTAVHYGKL